MMTACYRMAASFVVVFLLGTAAWAAEQVNVRAWPHDGYARVVFDWKSPVTYTAKIEGRVLQVTFERGLETSFDGVTTNLAEHVDSTAIADEGRTIRFTLKGDYELRHFVADGSVVLDLLQEGAAKQASNGKPVPVRAGQHAKFSRVVFDWPSIVDYQVEDEAGKVTLKFSRPGILDLSTFADPPRDIAGARQSQGTEGSVVTLDISKDSRVRHFRDGFKVVLDVQHSGSAPVAKTDAVPPPVTVAEAPPPPPAAEPEPEHEQVAAVPVSAPAPAPVVSEVLAPVAESAPIHPASSDHGSGDGHGAPAADRGEAAHGETASDHSNATGAPTVLTASSDNGAADSHGQAAGHEVAQAGSHGQTDPVDAGHGAVVSHGDDHNTASHGGEAGELHVTFSRSGDGGTLAFPFHGHTGAAAFRRGGQLWLVFDSPAEVNTNDIFTAAQDVLLGVDSVPVDGGLALRLDTIPGFNPTLTADGNEWLVNIRPRTLEPTEAAEVTVASDTSGRVIFVPLQGAAHRLIVSDPVVGDEIIVVTTNSAGTGIDDERSFVGFTVLESAQGMAVVARRDGIRLQVNQQGVAVGAVGGLAVTSIEERESVEQAAGGEDVVPRYFDFAGWSGEEGHYLETKQALQHHVSGTEGDERDGARLELARFYFGHGQAERVLGVLDAISRDGGPLGRSPAFKSLRGAASYLLGRYDAAAGDLADRRLDEEPEIALWRAALAGGREDWQTAAEGLRSSELYVQRYPDDLRARFSLLGAEASLHVEDPNGALAWLESLKGALLKPAQVGLMDVLHGRVLAATDHVEDAVEKFDAVIAGDDRKSRAMAVLARSNLRLETDEAGREEVLGDLDRLRFAWRGDDLEFDVLRRLGELQIESDDYRGGLMTLKRAAANFPQHHDVDGLTDLMQMTFSALYLDGGAEELPAIRAIAIFNEFRELTPTGTEGDEMIRRLADRLVSVDLLDQAVQLLSHQMEFRVEGSEKASVGTRLAIVQLMDRRPEGALEALRNSNVRGIPAPMVAERQLLEARSYAELGQIDDALARIAEDTSAEADRLRADIFMRNLDWRRAAEVLTRLAGAAPAQGQVIDHDRSVHVLNLAVALNLAGNRRGLDRLRRRFGVAMGATEFAYDFRVIASEDTNSSELKNALTRVAAVDDFKAFLEGYRARLARPTDG